MDSESQFDYTGEHLFIKIARLGSVGYASINGQMKPEFDNLLELDGSFYVYLLHPSKGSTFFTLEYNPDSNVWEPVGVVDWIEKDIMDEIIENVRQKKVC